VTGTTAILRVDASGRRAGSVTRSLGDALEDRLAELRPGAIVTCRDLADGIPLVDEDWIRAKNTPADSLSPELLETLALSDRLVGELQAADIVMIGAPIYNFTVPASLKAWIDLIARPRVTFRYTETGPVGLLSGKKTFVVAASGGTRAGSRIDFATGYLTHVLGFVGLTDVEWIDATGLSRDREATLAAARDRIDRLTL